jgi:hypothetical protein
MFNFNYECYLKLVGLAPLKAALGGNQISNFQFSILIPLPPFPSPVALGCADDRFNFSTFLSYLFFRPQALHYSLFTRPQVAQS